MFKPAVISLLKNEATEVNASIIPTIGSIMH
jgi:hypothetical protein